MRNLMHFFIIVTCMVIIGSFTQPLAKQEITGPDGKQFTVDILLPKDAFEYIKNNRGNKDFVILDIRTPEEFKDGHIEGAVNVDFRSEKYKSEVDKLDRNKTYFVYCRTGNRSRDAVNLMGPMGFRSLLRLTGDIAGWKSAGLLIVK